MSPSLLKVFVVDDEAPARMVTAFSLDLPCCRVTEFASGNECLDAIEQDPDVILLDIEMPGLDGIETCRSLRLDRGWQGHVIFVSSHSDLETRLRAYDAGGQDYIVKPFNPEELAQKIGVVEQLLAKRRELEKQVQAATQTAFTAMSSMGELGGVLEFIKASYSCESAEQLADNLLNALRSYGLEGLIELRIADRSIFASSNGACTPLEISILSHARGMERIFQFRDRMAINYPGITLFTSKLPLDDPDQVGRLRDHLAMLVEGADARLTSLNNEAVRQAQGLVIGDSFKELSDIIEATERQQKQGRLEALAAIDQMVSNLDHSFLLLELSHAQEEALSKIAHGAAEKLGGIVGESGETGLRLSGVASRLKQMVVNG